MMPNPADGYNERHIRKMKWRRIVTILSCIVVFCTTYALIIPAVTMSRDTACGKEEHTHTEACYDENGALICGREEHTHTDACLLAARELTYEDGQLTICLRVESMAPPAGGPDPVRGRTAGGGAVRRRRQRADLHPAADSSVPGTAGGHLVL